MICHRTIGPDVPILVYPPMDGDELPTWGYEFATAMPRECIGSECAMWVPDTFECEISDDGTCADNVKRRPWPDPAQEPKP